MLILGVFAWAFRASGLVKTIFAIKSINIVLHDKNIEAQNTQCFTVPGVQLFFYGKLLLAKTREARTTQSTMLTFTSVNEPKWTKSNPTVICKQNAH